MDGSKARNFFNLHFLVLRVLGLGWWHPPYESKTTNFSGWYIPYSALAMLVWVCGFVGLETLYPFFNLSPDSDQFMLSMSFVVTHNLTLVKLYVFFFKHSGIQRVAQLLEVELGEMYCDEATMRATVRKAGRLTFAFCFFGWLTIGNAIVTAAVADASWRRDGRPAGLRALPMPVLIPWDLTEDAAFVTAFALVALGLLWTGHIVMTIDTLIASLIIHVAGQFRILQDAFRTAPDRTLINLAKQLNDEEVLSSDTSSPNLNDEQFMDLLRKINEELGEERLQIEFNHTLRECVRQHQLLLECVEIINDTYSYGFLTQLASSLGAICVIMVQVSKDMGVFNAKSGTSIAFFFTMITQLAIQCFSAEDVTRNAAGVATAGMLSRWWRCDSSYQRMLQRVIQRAQRPVIISAAGYAQLSNGCFLSIVKAAYSYYAVIQNQDK